MRRVGGAALAALALAGAGIAALPGRSGGAEAPAVRVLDTRGVKPVPCPPVEFGGRFVEGGCSARANAFSTVFTIRTVFGGMRFGDCTTDFDMTIAADGRLWLDDLSFGGTPPCNDVWPCAPRSVIEQRKNVRTAPPRHLVPPWRGRLLGRAGDGYAGRFRLCMDTCAGRFIGDVAFRLVHESGGWRMRASRVGLPSSSLEVDAEWELLDSDFDVRVPQS